MNIEIIAGSPRIDSLSHRVALFLDKYLKEKSEHSIGLIDVRESKFPPIQKVFSKAEDAPDELFSIAKRVFEADAFVLVTPEYNGSYSPSMKNLLDHFPKQVHRAFGIVTASPGAMGGLRASQQMQLLINALFGIASPYMLVTPFVDKKFDVSGNLLDEAFSNSIHTFTTEFLWLAERISK
ncbi:MAG TPA: NAD(P)H-dependent oxidoreductase [Cytophagaceae bacterium]|jgi:NAD(P)H-dependent FMN reductase